MYGGHITDDWDRRLCRTYLGEYVRAEMLEGEILLAPGFQIPPNLDYKVRGALGDRSSSCSSRASLASQRMGNRARGQQNERRSEQPLGRRRGDLRMAGGQPARGLEN